MEEEEGDVGEVVGEDQGVVEEGRSRGGAAQDAGTLTTMTGCGASSVRTGKLHFAGQDEYLQQR